MLSAHKASMSTWVTEAGIVILLKELQPWKALDSMAFNVSGRVTSARFTMYKNTISEITVTPAGTSKRTRLRFGTEMMRVPSFE